MTRLENQHEGLPLDELARRVGKESELYIEITALLQTAFEGGYNGNIDKVLRDLDHGRRREVLEKEGNFESTYVNEEFSKYFKHVYWGGEDKKVLGRNFKELLLSVSDGNGGEYPRFEIPERMIHETMSDQMARELSTDLKEVVKELGIGGSNPGLVELNTGMGSWLYRLRDVGFDILATVERNPDLLDCTKRIWSGLNINGLNFVNKDAWDFVRDEIVDGEYEGKKVTAITADPPWAKYTSNGGEYNFSMFEPSGEEIISRLVKYAPVVAMKLPGGFNIDQIKSLSLKLEMGVRYFDYSMEMGTRTVREGMAVFISPEVNGDMKFQHTEKNIRE